jgi:hypothetical protein
MEKYEATPVVLPELTEWLDKQFPIQTPALTDTEREIFFKVGQRSVVDHLMSILKEQSDTILER